MTLPGEVRIDGIEEGPALGAEVFVDLESTPVEREKATDTAETGAEHKPDVAQRREGGDHVGPDCLVASMAILSCWTLGEWNTEL